MSTLKKDLSLAHLIFLTAGSIIGSGIMVIPALAASLVGAASILVWLAVGVLAICFSLVFAELASMYPTSGGIYTYVRKAFGDFWAFVIGWITFAGGWITIALLISAGLNYVSTLIAIPAILKSLIGVAIIGLVTLLNLRTLKGAGQLEIIVTGLTITSLTTLIFLGLFHSTTANFTPMKVAFLPFLAAAAYVFEPFMGWESVGFLAEEAKNKRNVSLALIIGTAIVIFIYLGISTVLIGVLGAETLAASSAPLLSLSGSIFGKVGSIIFCVLAATIVLGAVNSWVASLARLPYSMSCDKLLPATFEKTNRFGAPKNSLIFQFIFASVIFLFLGGIFKSLLDSLIPIALVIYTLVILAYIKLRRRETPEFDTKIGKYTPLIILPALALFAYGSHYSWKSVLVILGMIALCIPFYIQIKLKRDKEFLKQFFKYKILHRFNRKKMKLDFIQPLKFKKDDIILDYGCGTGVLTEYLAKQVPHGRVIAIDLVHEKLVHLGQTKRDLLIETKNVLLLEEDKAIKFEKGIFDKIISGGVLNYIHKPVPLLKSLHDSLRKTGEVAFAITDTWINPAPVEINTSKDIEKIFKEAGFNNIKVEYANNTFYVYATK